MTGSLFGGLYEAGIAYGPVWLWVVLTTSSTALLCVYAMASVDLFGKASNLTYRGLVTRGTYSIVRHPAYASKVSTWLIATTPFLIINPWFLVTMFAWTSIYVLRALTEERHIKMVARSEYEAYEKKVPYRFIPYVI